MFSSRKAGNIKILLAAVLLCVTVVFAQDRREPSDFEKSKFNMSFGLGALYSGDYGGGIRWREAGEQVKMPYNAGGPYLFFDATYAEAFLGFGSGSGKWESNNTNRNDYLPDMLRSYINFGVFIKRAITYGNPQLFLLGGIDYEASFSNALKYPNGGKHIRFDGSYDDAGGRHPQMGDLSAFWAKFGGALDIGLNIDQSTYLRIELLYGFRATNKFERDAINKSDREDVEAGGGHGLDLRVGVGFKFL